MDVEAPKTILDQLLRHSAWARRLAQALVRDAAQADDLVQEVWLAALRRPPAADKPARPWLAKVMRNALRQHDRADARRDAREALRQQPLPLPSPDELSERLDTQRALTEELAKLEEPYRSTVLLCYFEDLDPSEIARQQSLPASTVRWRLKRGLDELRERLDRRFGARRTWALLLVPFARPFGFTPLAPSGEVSSAEVGTQAARDISAATTQGSLLTGAWMMHAGLKLVSAFAIATVGYFGLSSIGWLPSPGWLSPKEQPVPVQFRPLAPQAGLATEVAVESAERTIAPQRTALGAAPAVDASTAVLTAPRAVFRAVARQSSGVPLEGARLTVHGRFGPPMSSAPSAADGTLSVELPAVAVKARDSIQAEVARSGFASQWTTALVDLERDVHLGNFRLLQGGAISGRVVDGNRLGVPDILVSAESASGSREGIDRRRLEFYAEGPSTRTLSDGSFLLSGVAPGFARVWASEASGASKAAIPKWLASFSPPVEVQVGQESMGVELTLAAFPTSTLVCGRVVDPFGAPVPYANLSFAKDSDGNHSAGSHNAGAQGEFRYVVPAGWTLTLVASDPKGQWDSASASELAGGELELELRLTESLGLMLSVRDQAGAPIEKYSVALFAKNGVNQLYELPLAEHEDGRMQLGRLAEEFLIEAKAPGYQAARSSTLVRSALSTSGAKVDLRLEQVPGIQGRVTAGGVPVGGATVELFTLAKADLDVAVNGHESRVMPFPSDTATSDEQGRFLLTARDPGLVCVRAQLAGYAPAEVSPLDASPRQGITNVELVLGQGGTIEGEVRLPDHSDPAGKIVGISRGDARSRTQRVGPDGRFRFERLMPGDWQVRLCDEEIGHSTSTRTSNSRGPKHWEFDCQVHEGRTTTFDIDLQSTTCRLSGSLTLDGKQAKAWTASLHHPKRWGSSALHKVDVDPQGTFALEITKPGEYIVAFEGAFEGHDQQIILSKIALRLGTTRRDFNLRMGSLIVENVPPAPGESMELMHLGFADDALCLTALAPDPSGRCQLASVPVGKGRIVRMDPSSMDPEQWPALVHCEVKPGTAATVSLP